MSASRLKKIIEGNQQKNKLTKVPFLSAGFPDRNDFWKNIIELSENGADIIEIGVPFSDPIADGPVVAAASQNGLENGGSLDYIFDGLIKHKSRIQSGMVLMGYVNPFIQYAWAEACRAASGGTVQNVVAESLKIFTAKAAECGVDGLVVPDLPLEESGPWLEALKPAGMDLIALVGPNTGLEKMKRYAASGVGGYVYVVSVMGTTGVREGLPPEVTDTLRRAKEAFNLPIALGFGLTSPDQLKAIDADVRPEAAVFGSALIKHLAAGGSAADFMAPWNE
ncbi:tryptophan synthase subunit alpha [Deltaproteobacteria bacterium Smac51]|nr:tryptophan synthase subunit alpha [Deltaproteobacteria bacterium Smac51]